VYEIIISKQYRMIGGLINNVKEPTKEEIIYRELWEEN
jgi:hypothetical protein